MAMKTKVRRRQPELLARRTFLAAGLGGLAAVAAQAVGAPSRVAGTNGDIVHVGRAHFGTARTRFSITSGAAAALDGWAPGGDGVAGGSYGPSSSGVYGYTTHPKGRGVTGRNTKSTTVGQLGTSRAGLYGTANDPNLFGLEVRGKLRFDRSGVARVKAGDIGVIVRIPVKANSFVLATVQYTPAGDIWVQSAYANISAGGFQILLNRNTPADVDVAWLLLDMD